MSGVAGAAGSSDGRRFPQLLIRADGAARGNPGPASAGAVLIDSSVSGASDPDAPPVGIVARPLGRQTNNVAEYSAVLFALEEARRLGAEEVELVLDSKLIVEQLNGRWKVKHHGLAPLVARVLELLGGFRRWSVRHEPRARNHAADALANLALDDPRGAAAMERRYRAVPGGGDSLPGSSTARVEVTAGGTAGTQRGAFPNLPRTWAQLTAEEPAIGVAGERLLRALAVGYLATVRDDGAPRIHPVTLTFHGDGLYIAVLARSPKLRDLTENGHFALHSFPTLPAAEAWADEELMVGGRARRVTDRAERAAVEQVHANHVGPDDVLFELRAERVLHRRLGAGRPVFLTWTAS